MLFEELNSFFQFFKWLAGKTLYCPKSFLDKFFWGGKLIYFRKSVDFSDGDGVLMLPNKVEENNETISYIEKKIDLIRREIDEVLETNIK